MLDKKSIHTKNLMHQMKMLGCLPLIDNFTRNSDNSTCIDKIFTDSNYNESSGVTNINISDHSAVFCTRKKEFEQWAEKQFTGRFYRFYDRDNFQNNIINVDWKSFYTARDVITCWDILEANILATIDAMCPVKHFKVSHSNDPWITNELLEEIRDKDLALKRARKSG